MTDAKGGEIVFTCMIYYAHCLDRMTKQTPCLVPTGKSDRAPTPEAKVTQSRFPPQLFKYSRLPLVSHWDSLVPCMTKFSEFEVDIV